MWKFTRVNVLVTVSSTKSVWLGNELITRVKINLRGCYTLKKGVLIFVQILTHLLVCFITHLLVCLPTHLKVCLTHLSLSQHTLRCAEKHTLGVLNTP